MFSTWKYLFAKNRVLYEMRGHGLLSRGEFVSMKRITANRMNRSIGGGLISRENIGNSYAAAGAVFANIGHLVKSYSDDQEPSYDLWLLAARTAMGLGGITEDDANMCVTMVLDHSASMCQKHDQYMLNKMLEK